MGDQFAIDRVTPIPVFYTVVSEDNVHHDPLGTVYAESDTHSNPGWITLGYVSIQSPFGQGVYAGFPREQVRIAEPKEIFLALKRDHPMGRTFRPDSPILLNIAYHRGLSRASENWTTDSGKRNSANNFSMNDLEALAREEGEKHNSITERWVVITHIQAGIISHKLNFPFRKNSWQKRYLVESAEILFESVFS